MTPHQLATELRPGNLLLMPDYNATYAEKSPTGGYLMHTFAIVLRADEEIISNLTGLENERKAYYPMYLREDSFRFLGLIERDGKYSIRLPGNDVSIEWTPSSGIVIIESGIPLKTDIQFAHQLQNHVLDTYGYDLKGASTEEMRNQKS